MPVITCPQCGTSLDVPEPNMDISIRCAYCSRVFCPLDQIITVQPDPLAFPREEPEEYRPRRRRDREPEQKPGLNYSYLNCLFLSLAIIFGIQAIVLVLFCAGVLTVFGR